MAGSYRVRIERCDPGATQDNMEKPTTVSVVPEKGFIAVMSNPNQAQLNGIARYMAKISAGTNTTAIETAIG